MLAMGVDRKQFDRKKAEKHMPAAWIDVSLFHCVAASFCVCLCVSLCPAHTHAKQKPLFPLHSHVQLH